MWDSNVTVGDDCHIHESVVFDGIVKVGDNVKIGPGCSIGFSGASVDLIEGVYVLRENKGITVIENDVTILGNVDVQHGARIGRGTIISNQCNIAHHSIIGPSVRIHAGSILAGHVEVGERAVLHCNVTVAVNVKIGEFARVGIGSVVICDVPPRRVYFGVPARSQGEQRMRGKIMRELLEEYKRKTM